MHSPPVHQTEARLQVVAKGLDKMARALLHRRWEEMARSSGYNARKLASLYSISLRQLEREFQKTRGRSPQKWLDEQRIASARKMLLEGLSVKCVALELGYKQSSHFCRHFKERNGMTPSEFVASVFVNDQCRYEITNVVQR